MNAKFRLWKQENAGKFAYCWKSRQQQSFKAVLQLKLFFLSSIDAHERLDNSSPPLHVGFWLSNNPTQAFLFSFLCYCAWELNSLVFSTTNKQKFHIAMFKFNLMFILAKHRQLLATEILISFSLASFADLFNEWIITGAPRERP